ncbi:MAG: ABC transporter substrate-binding protein, partial [Clostridia bacterium]|nr:ABC transporter substrate-binding protein [Clostridia bacterium]
MRNRFYTAVVAFILGLLIASCGTHPPSQSHYTEIEGLTFTEREQLSYAEGFSIDRYEGGYSLIATNGGKFLVVPEGKDAPKGLNSDITVLKQPVNNIYLAATADMTFFDKLGALDAIRFSSVKENDWYIDNAKAAMENGNIVYAGKYREPDYELLLDGGCTFSIQSTMIDHTPEVKEKLEELGVTVFTDYSSYEGHPLGRSEWVKVYGEITGKAEKAAELFKEQEQKLSEINSASVKKSVAFFYINNAGQISVRKSDDY